MRYLTLALLVASWPAAAEDPCAALSKPVAYDPAVPVPASAQKLVVAYRERWKAFCAKKGSSLAELYELAMPLAAAFEKDVLTEKLQSSEDPKIPDLVANAYPAFVPAFEGSIVEYTYFKPSEALFAEAAKSAAASDREFWQDFFPLSGGNGMPEWYEQTWDHGGCLRFGAFDWAKALESLGRLKKPEQAKPYRELVSRLDAQLTMLFQQLEKEPICTCGKTGAVVPDLELIAKRAHASLKPLVEKVLSGVKSKKVKVLSNAEASCAGG